MSYFVVRFLKNMVGDQGQLCEACQHVSNVDADNEVEAIRLAQLEFCALRAVGDWRLHADRIDVKPADFPS